MKTDAKITMSTKEVNIMQACIGVSNRSTTKRAAAKKVGMTERHFYRCYDTWVDGGEHALTHKARGARGNHRHSQGYACATSIYARRIFTAIMYNRHTEGKCHREYC